MHRIVCNVSTGEISQVDLTIEEIVELEARAAAYVEPTQAPVPTKVVAGGETYFQRFQQSLEARATSANPLDFRGSRLKKDLDNLLNIFAFVRDIRLSTLAGER